MRILVVDMGYANLNSTVQSWKLPWKLLGEVEFFGPGLSTSHEWASGLSSYVRRRGPFDVVVMSEMFLQATLTSQSLADRARTIRGSYWCPFDVEQALDASSRLLEEWQETEAIRILSMLEFDSYNMTDEHREVLQALDAYVIGWGQQFIRPRSQIQDLSDEFFADRVNDNWRHFVVNHAERVISLPSFVSECEFSWTPLEDRRGRFALQGARYAARREMKRDLRHLGERVGGRWQPWLLAGLARVRRDALARPRVQAAFKFEWDWVYRTNKIGFACGSRLGFPLRKFFEIPAAGAVLLAEPCNGFDDLGFRHRTNCLSVREIELAEVLDAIAADPIQFQVLADRGRELIWNAHSLHARSQQYRETIEAIGGGRFRGSYWAQGNYLIAEPEVV